MFRDAVGMGSDLPPGLPRSRGVGGAFLLPFWGNHSCFAEQPRVPSANQPSTISGCFLPPGAPVELLEMA